MATDKNLEHQFSEYQDIAKTNPNVDVASLMINALQTQKQNVVSTKMKHWAYLIALSLPPFGMIFAVKFWFGDEDDAKTCAYVCTALTVMSLLMFWFIGKLMFSSAGVSVDQIQQIKPKDVMQLYQ